MAGARGPRREREGVEAVERALALIAAIGEESRPMPLAALAARSGLNKSTILRLSVSLERFGYLTRGADGRFALGSAPFRLAAAYRRARDPAAAVRACLDDLVEASGESAAFYIRIGERRLCLARRNSPRPARHHVEEGEIMALGQGSPGRVLLAFSGASGPAFEAVRAAGMAIAHGERDPDVAGVSAPVFGPDGALYGALVLSGLITRFTPEATAAHAMRVRVAAEALSRDLSGADAPAKRGEETQ